MVQPLIPQTGRGSVRQVVFSRFHLDEIFGKIARLPKLDAVNDGKLHPISYAAQRGAGRYEAIFSAILDGNSSAFVHPESPGLGRFTWMPDPR